MTHDAYRRRARRLRRLYAHNPALLHHHLRRLAQSEHPTPAEQPFAKTPSLAANSPVARQFADRVAAHLDAGLLRYSHRLALLKEADRLGIKRFEANLIIAVTQHRHRPPTPFSPNPAPPLPRHPWLLPTTLALTLQAALLTLLYLALA